MGVKFLSTYFFIRNYSTPLSFHLLIHCSIPITLPVLSFLKVADWIEYGVQLPSETSELFRQNAVTGYDFAELVADDGAALAHELGIHRAAYQKKLLRSMRMLMSGVGVAPDKPQVHSYIFTYASRPPSCRCQPLGMCGSLFTSSVAFFAT